jgi:uncharacterized protein YbaR (Trm112 family)
MDNILTDNATIEENAEDMKFFYVIHGTIPELMPSVAYRREGKDHQHERKILKCPLCLHRLTDTSVETRIELYKHPIRVNVDCQFYMRCSNCQCEIGINIANAA